MLSIYTGNRMNDLIHMLPHALKDQISIANPITNPIDPRTRGNTSPSTLRRDNRPRADSTTSGNYTTITAPTLPEEEGLTSTLNRLNLEGSLCYHIVYGSGLTLSSLLGLPQPQANDGVGQTFGPSSSTYTQYGTQQNLPQSQNWPGQTNSYNQAAYGQTGSLSQSAPNQQMQNYDANFYAQTSSQYGGQYYTATTATPSAASQVRGHIGNEFTQQGGVINGTPGEREQLDPG